MDIGEYRRMDDFQKSHWWYQGRRFIVRSLFCRYTEGTGASGGSFLDIGCGTGEGKAIIGSAGSLVGIDASDEALSIAKSKGYASLQKGSVEKLPHPSDSFDGVLALDVLEHIGDDQAAFGECFRVLRPGGSLILTVPAYQWLWSGHDDVFGHKRRYLKGELAGKAEAAGLEIVFASHYVTLLFPVIAVWRSAGKLFRNRRVSHFFPLPRVLNGFLFCLMAFEGLLLRSGCRLPFGSSLILVAKKKR